MNSFAALLKPSIPAHSSWARVLSVVALRALFLGLLVSACNRVIPLGTPTPVLWCAAAVGTAAGSWLSFSRLKNLGALVLTLTVWLLGEVLCGALDLLPHGTRGLLTSYLLSLHLELFMVVSLCAATTTWIFWRIRGAATVEALLLAAMGVASLASHRNYRLDLPNVVNALAWRLGVDHLTMLIIFGIAMGAALCIYLYIASLAGRPNSVSDDEVSSTHSARPSVLRTLTAAGLITLFVGLISRELYRFHHRQAASQTANGVGQGSTDGMSPLSFHSALGSTNQPSGIVRLEGDYPSNPFIPMLYLRESALSELRGNEIVQAERRFDRDVPAVSPAQSFSADEEPTLTERTPVLHSIYLLSEHQNAFAIDYPTELIPLKNPNPGRFKAAYRARSLAPAFALSGLALAEVGDPKWTDEERRHYLEPHKDPRYGEVARSATTRGNTSLPPVAQALALVEYLSKEAIYTLTPNHEVRAGEDPVAAFLFGDKRGYCVHFAHAMVYMLRDLGIPSRIGTGYLTDLSQAKDGHILLRMSDRHAWAEVFISGRGWIPFDVQPERVESHAETDVDMKLLEELMGLLGPGDEILPPEQIAQEPSFAQESGDARLIRVAGMMLGIIVLLMFAAKLYLRYGWITARSPAARAARSYRALCSLLHDLGYRREFGETRFEFRRRVRSLLNRDVLSVTQPLLESIYAGANTISCSDVDEARGMDRRSIRAAGAISPWRGLAASLSVSSVVFFVGRGRW